MTGIPPYPPTVSAPPPGEDLPEPAGDAAITLAELCRLRPLTWPIVRWLGLQLAESLEELHLEGRHHGNMVPGGLLLSPPWTDLRITPAEGTDDGSEKEDLAALGSVLAHLLDHCGQPIPVPCRDLISALHAGRPAAMAADVLAGDLLDSLAEDAEGEDSPEQDTLVSAPLRGKTEKSVPRGSAGSGGGAPRWIMPAGIAAVVIVGALVFLLKKPEPAAPAQPGIAENPATSAAADRKSVV